MAAKEAAKPDGREGLGIDYRGAPAIDPSENVKALNEAVAKRSDDLRVAAAELTALQFRLADKIAALRDHHVRELMAAESRRVDQQALLRAEYVQQLADKESARINAIRTVDVQAVNIASQRASDAAGVLQAQVSASAETLRSLVASTAAANAAALQQVVTGLDGRLTKLEQGSYQAAGKQQYSDPEMLRLLAEVKVLNDQARNQSGKTEGFGQSWGILLGVALLVSVGVGVIALLEKPVAPAAPQVVYVSPTPPAAPIAAAPAKP
jgi:hypothetical protein